MFRLFLLTFLMAFAAQAKMFTNAYISFEMPDNWECKPEQVEWVCRSTSAEEMKDAVIVLTAKEKGPADSIDLYRAHLDSSITTTTKTGLTLTSVVKYKAETKRINDQDWLDALHQDSEVKNYYTRYVATVKDKIAILITFNAHNKAYAKNSDAFNKAIQTLKIADEKSLSREMGGLGSNSEIFSKNDGIGTLLADTEIEKPAESKGLFKNSTFIGLSLMVLAVLLYIVFKIYLKKDKK